MTANTSAIFDEVTRLDRRKQQSNVEKLTGKTRLARLPRRLFIHIGTHKTGTTSIQNFLRLHAGNLKECGIFVPKSGTLNTNSGHHNIAWEIRNDPRYSRKIDGIDALISELAASREECAVISSEDFEYLVQYPEELKAFDRRIEALGFSTKYIVYFRDRDSYARSLHCELAGSGLSDDFETFRRSIDTLGYVRVNRDLYYEFRYELFVKRWEEILGQKVQAYSYDDAVVGTGLLPSFLSMIGASQKLIDESRTAPVVNTMFDKFQQVSRDLQQATRELAAIKASTSWRITAPLRFVVKLIRKLSGG